jgi:DNA-binding SARP family transcriptional activator
LLALLEDGDLQLADDLAAEWLEDPRGEFARRLADILGDLAGLWDDRAPTRSAVDLARRLVRLDAFDERAWRIIIRHHLATGNRSLALRRYRELCELLEDELGVEPSYLTRQLLDEPEETGNFHFAPVERADDPEEAALSARISAIRQRILALDAELSGIASELAKRNL